MFLVGFPLLIVAFALYNMIAFLLPGVSWTQGIVGVRLMSGADWAVTPGAILIAIAMLLLFGELVKTTRLGRRTIVDHLLSSALFIGMLAEFLLVKQAASGTFFLLLVISFVDVAAGFTITLRARRLASAVGAAAAAAPTVRVAPDQPVEKAQPAVPAQAIEPAAPPEAAEKNSQAPGTIVRS